MKTKSVKAKGRKLQNFVRDELRDSYHFDGLEDDDIKSQTMGMTGEDIVLSPAARKLINFSFECKNVEKLSIWKTIEQCEDNAVDMDGNLKGHPTVVFKKNGKNPHVVISWKTFKEMLQAYIYVEVEDEEIYEDGELKTQEAMEQVLYRIFDTGTYRLTKRRDK